MIDEHPRRPDQARQHLSRFLYLPPRCKYRKQPFLSATSAASLAAKTVYSAISRMLTREEPYFRSQWKRAICLSTASDASSDETFSGVNSFEISRISLNATVMPPPSKRISHVQGIADKQEPRHFLNRWRKEFGMLRNLPRDTASRKLCWQPGGSSGSTTFSIWPFMPQVAGLALGSAVGSSPSTSMTLASTTVTFGVSAAALRRFRTKRPLWKERSSGRTPGVPGLSG
ncbi:uncharacterized protein ASPGLDRAFT_22348 [Aspergillus glaucus CBS 516.65]|uniref:Uncharacterized protein n=1 Tax=Aspergillus glaucus CBS 516.65 TaxID=1160497 RepID=A0A1L9VY97_ASPGL|nr:hypothetical protein ASPGLDRAFT_22348 [Aspergillus glaucus CBS 516.65]OJJ88894.1 hypothetical protein ASPGLDRAFT_22348 [Aspergillus glaucus CBS 516.65]